MPWIRGLLLWSLLRLDNWRLSPGGLASLRLGKKNWVNHAGFSQDLCEI